MGDTISAARVREAFDYNPESGLFFWKKAKKPCWNGKQTGVGFGSHGYHQLWLDGKVLLAHRVAWIFQTGAWPSQSVDHINGDRSDNRFSNLRLATPADQNANARLRKNNVSGFKGVSWSEPRNGWRARIQSCGQQIEIGLFDTPEAAHAAYCSKAKQIFGSFARAS